MKTIKEKVAFNYMLAWERANPTCTILDYKLTEKTLIMNTKIIGAANGRRQFRIKLDSIPKES